MTRPVRPIIVLRDMSEIELYLMWDASGSTFVEVIETELSIDKYTKLVTDPSAGAIASFVGTTRNTFDGKAILRLEYEAYVPMALKQLQEVSARAQERWGLTKVAIAHRVGVVSVAETSVIICISSPHRAACLEACHWAIDELKACVPIWKKEFFADGSVWKENAEARRLYNAQKA